jgi:hypothetical protein
MEAPKHFAGSTIRAGEAGKLVTAVATTERGVALWVLGALAALVIMRRGFRGALGD